MNRQAVASNAPGAAVFAPAAPHIDANKKYEERIRKLYEIVSSRPLLTKRTHYMNMGYWKDGAPNLDDACEAMARFIGDFAELCPDDRILDAGCGFGDQDICWVRRYAPRKIAALNISAVQVQAARRRIEELGLHDCIDMHLGSATDLPFEDGSFDKVVSLESAQHFGTREDFFHEAHRVLRSRGRIFTTDIIPMPDVSIGSFALNALSLNRHNMYPRDIYAQKLSDAGFTDVSVTSVRDVVLVPFKRYMDRTTANTPFAERLRHRVRRMLVPTYKLDYVVAKAARS